MQTLPTTDLYFLNSCGHHVGGWLRRGPVRRLGANSFATDRARLLVRNDTKALMEAFLADTGKKRIYLVDDDIEMAAEDPSLPAAYRARLAAFSRDHHQALCRMADTLVVSSPQLVGRFSWHADVRLLHPVWHLAPADTGHFAALAKGGAIRAVHMGTGSHQGGLMFLKPVVEALLAEFERFEFTYVRKTPELGTLDGHPRVTRIAPERWSKYRRTLARRRFHLAFYPLHDTAFGAARSRNKLIEHALVGAVGVYPESWPVAAELGKGAIYAGAGAAAWTDAVRPYLTAPEKLLAVYDAGLPLVTAMNDPAPQRAFWADLLGIGR